MENEKVLIISFENTGKTIFRDLYNTHTISYYKNNFLYNGSDKINLLYCKNFFKNFFKKTIEKIILEAAEKNFNIIKLETPSLIISTLKVPYDHLILYKEKNINFAYEYFLDKNVILKDFEDNIISYFFVDNLLQKIKHTCYNIHNIQEGTIIKKEFFNNLININIESNKESIIKLKSDYSMHFYVEECNKLSYELFNINLNLTVEDFLIVANKFYKDPLCTTKLKELL